MTASRKSSQLNAQAVYWRSLLAQCEPPSPPFDIVEDDEKTIAKQGARKSSLPTELDNSFDTLKASSSKLRNPSIVSAPANLRELQAILESRHCPSDRHSSASQPNILHAEKPRSVRSRGATVSDWNSKYREHLSESSAASPHSNTPRAESSTTYRPKGLPVSTIRRNTLADAPTEAGRGREVSQWAKTVDKANTRSEERKQHRNPVSRVDLHSHERENANNAQTTLEPTRSRLKGKHVVTDDRDESVRNQNVYTSKKVSGSNKRHKKRSPTPSRSSTSKSTSSRSVSASSSTSSSSSSSSSSSHDQRTRRKARRLKDTRNSRYRSPQRHRRQGKESAIKARPSRRAVEADVSVNTAQQHNKYGVLGLPPGTNRRQLKATYQTIISRLEKCMAEGTAELRVAACKKLSEVNEAWAVLGDERLKRQYDKALDVGAFSGEESSSSSSPNGKRGRRSPVLQKKGKSKEQDDPAYHKSYYQVLNVKPDAPAETINKQARQVILITQQMIGTEKNAARLKEMVDGLDRIKKAYKILKNPDKRKKYDKWLLEGSSSSEGSANEAELEEKLRKLRLKKGVPSTAMEAPGQPIPGPSLQAPPATSGFITTATPGLAGYAMPAMGNRSNEVEAARLMGVPYPGSRAL